VSAAQVNPRPPLKWLGGKSQLIPELLKRIPKTWNRETDAYFEPFLGAGALFWELQPKIAVLNDANEELVNVWRMLRESSSEVIDELRAMAEGYARDPEMAYATLRNLRIPGVEQPNIWRAARMIALNKTCFNGLYRVNAGGGFNVPWGQNPKAHILDEENLVACAQVLQIDTRQIYAEDFEEHFCDAPAKYGDDGLRGALVYFDSPYALVSKTSNFTAYTAGGFSYFDQCRLVVLAVRLQGLGCHVMLSQAADEILIDQYRRCGFKCDKVSARRNVNSKGGKRGPVGEYIIYGGK